ncbi:MAG: hypothetical protein IJT59_03430, partial [Desulfovibrionaceae bacterium]|nr:hypothetical protein [Desulfovibrionaceae bacterium]
WDSDSLIKLGGKVKYVLYLVDVQKARMDIRLLDGTKVNASVGYKNLKLLEMRKNYLIEQRKVD